MTFVDRLSPRERFMLILLFVVAVPMALWALVLVPLNETRDRALFELAGAQADYIWVAEQAEQFSNNLPAEASAVGPLGLAALEVALEESNLRASVSALESTPSGDMRLVIEGVPFDIFGRFLDDLAMAHIFSVTALRIEPSEVPGQINASVGLK